MTNWVHFSHNDDCLPATNFPDLWAIKEIPDRKHIVIYDYFVILLSGNNGHNHQNQKKAYILPYRGKITHELTFIEKKSNHET